MSLLTLQHDGRIFAGMEPAELRELGVPSAVIADAIKAAAKATVVEMAETYRQQLASRSAAKLAEYRVKEEIARDPENAADAELLIIDREAEARGMSRADLLSMIAQQASAYRLIALLVGAIEAETNAAIEAVNGDDTETAARMNAILAAAKSEADAAFVEAKTLINGGS